MPLCTSEVYISVCSDYGEYVFFLPIQGPTELSRIIETLYGALCQSVQLLSNSQSDHKLLCMLNGS